MHKKISTLPLLLVFTLLSSGCGTVLLHATFELDKIGEPPPRLISGGPQGDEFVLHANREDYNVEVRESPMRNGKALSIYELSSGDHDPHVGTFYLSGQPTANYAITGSLYASGPETDRVGFGFLAFLDQEDREMVRFGFSNMIFDGPHSSYRFENDQWYDFSLLVLSEEKQVIISATSNGERVFENQTRSFKDEDFEGLQKITIRYSVANKDGTRLLIDNLRVVNDKSAQEAIGG